MLKTLGLFIFLTGVTACSKDDEKVTDTQKSSSADALSWTCPEKASASKLNLFNSQSLPSLPQWMQDEVLAQNANLSTLTAKPLIVKSNESNRKMTLSYEQSGIPLCRVFGRIDQVGNKRFVQDQSRRLKYLKTSETDWADLNVSLSSAMSQLSIQGETTSIESKKCWWDEGNTLFPAWDIHAATAEGSISAFANGPKVYAASPNRMDLEGIAHVHDQNINGPLIDVPLHDLEETGTLRNSHFAMITPTGFLVPQDPKGYFAAEPEDSRFNEISLFANVTRMAEWFAQFKATKSVDCDYVELHSTIKGDLNNGYYAPATRSAPAAIYMAKGDGVTMQNLQTDADTVAHELGHHIIIRSLTDVTDKKSLIIHEGLADFFVFARSGDFCLGETICPAEGKYCVKQGQCLRSADNSFTFTDPGLSWEVHAQSQVLSGMLWDIGSKIGLDTTAALTFSAIDYLKPRSDFVDLTRALMMADLELNKGLNACLILQHAKDRALSIELENLDCHDFITE